MVFSIFQVRKIGHGVGFAVHGLLFQLADGSRVGTVLLNEDPDVNKPMNLYDDDALAERGITWVDLEAGDQINAVYGHASLRGYLAYDVTLTFHSGRAPLELTPSGPGTMRRKHVWCDSTRTFRWDAEPGCHVVGLSFKHGTCIAAAYAPSHQSYTQEDDSAAIAVRNAPYTLPEPHTPSSDDSSGEDDSAAIVIEDMPAGYTVEPEVKLAFMHGTEFPIPSFYLIADYGEKFGLTASRASSSSDQHRRDQPFELGWEREKHWIGIIEMKAGKWHHQVSNARKRTFHDMEEQTGWPLNIFYPGWALHIFNMELTARGSTAGAVKESTLEVCVKKTTWRLSYPSLPPAPSYTLLLGFFDFNLVGAQETVALCVNEDIFAMPYGLFREVKIPLQVRHGELKVELSASGGCDCDFRLCNLQLWKGNVTGTPRVVPLDAEEAATAPPTFDPAIARGRAQDWNAPDNVSPDSAEYRLFWGRPARVFFANLPETVPNICTVLNFLNHPSRTVRGRSALALLGPPMRQGDGWFSLHFKGFTNTRKQECKDCQWFRAWHGAKFEAIYSTLHDGKLAASRGKEYGERCLPGRPGVYCYRDKFAHLAEGYINFVPLGSDGVFWAAKWEVCVDRWNFISSKGHKNQWIQHEDGVHIVALWICGRSKSEMRDGRRVSRRWKPELEASPIGTR